MTHFAVRYVVFKIRNVVVACFACACTRTRTPVNCRQIYFFTEKIVSTCTVLLVQYCKRTLPVYLYIPCLCCLWLTRVCTQPSRWHSYHYMGSHERSYLLQYVFCARESLPIERAIYRQYQCTRPIVPILRVVIIVPCTSLYHNKKNVLTCHW